MNKSIAVIGAGITGLVTSLFLCRLGYDVSLFERSTTPRAIGAGITISPLGLFVLEKLGLRQDVIKLGTAITKIKGQNEFGKTILNINYKDFHKGAYSLGIHRANLFRILLKEVQKDKSIKIYYGKDINKIIKGKKSSLITRDHCLLGLFDAIIISNGAHSTLHQQLEFQTSVKPYDWGTLWSIIPRYDSDNHYTLEQFYKSSQVTCGLLPSGLDLQGNKITSLFVTSHKKQFANWQELSLQEWKIQLFANISESVQPYFNRIKSKSEVIFTTYNKIKTKRCYDGNSLLIGDAAHALSPQLGMGVSLGLFDAWSLYQILQEEENIEEAFIKFSNLRCQHINYNYQVSSMLTPLFQSSFTPWANLRDYILPFVQRYSALHSILLDTVIGTRTSLLNNKPVVIKEDICKIFNS